MGFSCSWLRTIASRRWCSTRQAPLLPPPPQPHRHCHRRHEQQQPAAALPSPVLLPLQQLVLVLSRLREAVSDAQPSLLVVSQLTSAADDVAAALALSQQQ